MLQALMHGEETGRLYHQEASRRAVRPNRELLIRQVDGVNAFGFLDPSRRVYGIPRSQGRARGAPKRKAFSYNKRGVPHSELAEDFPE
jgi:hypothetical protein